MHPEIAWRLFIAHSTGCPRCHQAGGERAHADTLCRTGRALLTHWEDAELAWARLRRHNGARPVDTSP